MFVLPLKITTTMRKMMTRKYLKKAASIPGPNDAPIFYLEIKNVLKKRRKVVKTF